MSGAPLPNAQSALASSQEISDLQRVSGRQGTGNWWSNAWKSIVKFYTDNKSWINPAVQGIATVAGFLGPVESHMEYVNVLKLEKNIRPIVLSLTPI